MIFYIGFILSYQWLLPPHRFRGKDGILKFIKQVGAIQFDTLNQVGYNSHLVLQSRVANYKA
ncbi:hypothetical protein U472_09535 [Orenia metallireducens]|uniref:Uncharacterized protein n=1 Tax=Orenia metallireducens TaxID=1413210 RepID=A0A1C0A7Q2_9FIRM|nr:hypothetical protein U472_09535 [Orenia metallireducens]